jgi:hypothetical protein
MRKIICCVVVALIEQACAQQAPPDLSVALMGIDKATFLTCSGLPSLELPQAGQERMSFVTNLRRGSPIGITNPTAAAPESCSADTVLG